MTPEEAIALEPGTTPGPWKARHGSYNTSYVREEEWFSAIGSAEFGHVEAEYTPADANLIAAAPDMRATIAAQTWEWGVEDAYGDTAWMVCDHYEGTQDSETEAREYLSTFGPDSIARLVRRPVGPVEVVEDDWP